MEPIKKILLQQGRSEAWGNGAENQSVHLTYDIGAHLSVWPDAVPSVAFERADGSKYPHAWELDGTILHIPLLLADTEVPGSCKCMITLTQGDGRSNTAIFYGVVTRGIDSLGEEPEEPMLGVIEQVNQAAADAHTAQVGAEAAQKEAKDSADLARGYKDDVAADAEVTGIYRDEAREYAASAINARIYAERAQDDALASKEAAASSEENAVNAAHAAAEHAQSAKENAEEAKSEAANAKSEADNAMAHAKAAEEALSNMEERYYIPSASEDGKLVFTPNADGMPEVPPMDIRGDVDGLFVVKYRKNEDGTETVNKTYDEIKEACEAGLSPIIFNESNCCIYTPDTPDFLEGAFLRFNAFGNENTRIIENYINVFKNGSVSSGINRTLKAVAQYALNLTGAVEATYDGGTPVNVEIPESKAFIVHSWYDSDAHKYKADHMVDEIKAAVDDGFIPILIHANLAVYSLYSITDVAAYFYSNSTLGTGEIKENRIIIMASSVSVSTGQIVYAPNKNPITFTGAVETTYDGSAAVNIEVPESNVFVVNVAFNSAQNKYEADKTVDEILTAVNSGEIPILVLNKSVYMLEYTATNEVAFYHLNDKSGGIAKERFRILPSSAFFSETILKTPNPNAITFTGAVEANYDGSTTATVSIPEKLPTVGKLLLRGAVSADFDGSEDVTVNIPDGGGGGGGGSGATPNWDANEGEAGYIENRTHWVERGAGEDVLYDNETLVYNEELGGFLVTSAPKRDFVDGETIKVTFGEAVFECPCSYIQDPDSGVVGYIIGNVGAVNPEVDMNDIPFVFIMLPNIQDLGDGTMVQGMFMPMGELGTTEFSMTARVDLYHQLDYRYVGTKYSQPDWGKDSVLVKEAWYDTLAADEPIVPFFSPIEMHDGEKYEVTYNDEKYERTATEVPGIGATIGNPSGFGGADNGDPFMFITFTEEAAAEQGCYALFAALDGSSGSLLISIVGLNGAGTVHKIPKEYIENPNAPLLVTLNDRDVSSSTSFDVDFDTIWEAFKAGRNIILRTDDGDNASYYRAIEGSHTSISFASIFLVPDSETLLDIVVLNHTGSVYVHSHRLNVEAN